MGHMSLCMVRDGARKKTENLFQLSYRRSHHVPGDRLIMSSSPHPYKDEREKRLFEQDGEYNDQVFATHSWHTSGKGVMILTTDYFLNLFFESLPERDSIDPESPEAIMEAMKGQFRKMVSKMRQDYGRDHPMVTRKPLVKKNPKAMAALPAEVEVNADLTHVCALNYDMLHEDDDKTDDAMEALQQAYGQVSGDMEEGQIVFEMHGGPLRNFRSLDHWVSLRQGDVVLIEYDHLCMKRAWRLGRTRRTPADELLKQEKEWELPATWMTRADNFILLREFLNSQGYETNL